MSGTISRLVSDVPNPVDTPLYPNTIKCGQRSSEALLNAATKCYIKGVSTRHIGKMFDQSGIESISSTLVSDSNKSKAKGLDLGEIGF